MMTWKRFTEALMQLLAEAALNNVLENQHPKDALGEQSSFKPQPHHSGQSQAKEAQLIILEHHLDSGGLLLERGGDHKDTTSCPHPMLAARAGKTWWFTCLSCGSQRVPWNLASQSAV